MTCVRRRIPRVTVVGSLDEVKWWGNCLAVSVVFQSPLGIASLSFRPSSWLIRVFHLIERLHSMFLTLLSEVVFIPIQASVSPRVTSVDAFPPSIHTANILHFTNTSKFFQKNVGENIFFHPVCSFLFVSNESIRSCPGWDARVSEGSMKEVRVGVWDKNNVGEISHLAHIHSIKRTCYLLY